MLDRNDISVELDNTPPPVTEFKLSVFAQIFYQSYRPSGYDPVTKKVHGESLATTFYGPNENAVNYLTNYITWLTAFFALPDGFDPKTKKQTWKNVFLQFIGWNATSRPWLKPFVVLLFTLWNVLTWPLNLTLNVLKLFTEVLPLCLTFATIAASTAAFSIGVGALTVPFIIVAAANASMLYAIPFSILLLPVTALSFAVGGVFGAIGLVLGIAAWLGRCTTSPLDQVLDNWKYFANTTTNPWINRFLQLSAATFSLLVTVAIYAVIAMFAAPFLAAVVGPAIVTAAPLWLVPALHAIGVGAAATMHFIGVAGLGSTLGIQALALTAALATGFLVVGSIVKSLFSRIVSPIVNWMNPEPAAGPAPGPAPGPTPGPAPGPTPGPTPLLAPAAASPSSTLQAISDSLYAVMLEHYRLHTLPQSDERDAIIQIVAKENVRLRLQLHGEIKRSEGLDGDELKIRVLQVVGVIDKQAEAAASAGISSPEDPEQQRRDATSASALAAGHFGPVNSRGAAPGSAASPSSVPRASF